MSDGRDDGVPGVDAGEGVGEGGDGTVWRGPAVPVLRPPLRDVFEVPGGAVVLGADDGGDRLVVCDAAGAEGAVGEEVGVEGEGAEGDDEGEGEVVDVGVVLAGEGGEGGVLGAHDVEVELLARAAGGELDVLFEETGREVVVVAAAVVEV